MCCWQGAEAWQAMGLTNELLGQWVVIGSAPDDSYVDGLSALLPDEVQQVRGQNGEEKAAFEPLMAAEAEWIMGLLDGSSQAHSQLEQILLKLSQRRFVVAPALALAPAALPSLFGATLLGRGCGGGGGVLSTPPSLGGGRGLGRSLAAPSTRSRRPRAVAAATAAIDASDAAPPSVKGNRKVEIMEVCACTCTCTHTCTYICICVHMDMHTYIDTGVLLTIAVQGRQISGEGSIRSGRDAGG